jgi:S-DNA-T family DNA segregation ATPase FtsK/SpoIIIE
MQQKKEEPRPQHMEEPPVQKKKEGFFNKIARVPSPDQVLNGQQQEVKQPEPQPVTTAPVAPVESEPVPVADAAAAEPVFSEEPVAAVSQPAVSKQEKVSKQEAKQAAEEVAQDIQRTLDEQEDAPYQYPPLSLLKEADGGLGGDAMAELNANRQRLTDTIHSFGIDANIVNVTRGPSVTRYELELDQGVRLSKLTNLADDIALALGAPGVRIAPIPDQISMVGIEVPNKLVSPVNIHSVIGSRAFTDSSSKVSFAVGKDIGGNAIVGNIAKMPHMLIAGTTGSGKSVCTNSLIVSLLYKATPEEVRLIMVDPKMVELGIYNGIPHLLIPVVTDPKKAAGALQWAVFEMMKRYKAFSEVGVRDLASYNAKAAKTEGMEKMPQVVVIIDELADLMLVAAKEVEESICRVAQMGRASGMHLIIATQRPSADVITGLMKANIPSRIAFAVASSLESRIILDITGAEKLVGRGDMLYFPLGSGKPTRVQGCLITDQEVASVVEFIKQTGNAQYDDAVMQEIEQHAAEKEKGANKGNASSSAAEDAGTGDYDELIDAATEVVVETGMASVSMLQRRLKLGYARAARLVDQLEDKGIVGPFEGSKPRQVLINKEQWQEMKFRQGGTVPTISADAPAAPLDDLPPFDVEEAMDAAREDTL